MPAKTTARTRLRPSEKPLTVRFPEKLLEALRLEASRNRRSQNSEIVFRIQSSFEQTADGTAG